jgi:hypothetical protein
MHFSAKRLKTRLYHYNRVQGARADGALAGARLFG